MNRNVNANVIAIAIAIASTVVVFATGVGAAEPVKPPTRDPQLDQLIGRWEGRGTFTVGGKATAWNLVYDCQAALGPAVVCNVVGTGGGMRYEEVHLFGFDKASGKHHLFSVNSWGEAYDHAAQWRDDKRVSFEHSGAAPDGKARVETYTYELKSPKEMSLHGTLTVDGKVAGDGVYTLAR